MVCVSENTEVQFSQIIFVLLDILKNTLHVLKYIRDILKLKALRHLSKRLITPISHLACVTSSKDI